MKTLLQNLQTKVYSLRARIADLAEGEGKWITVNGRHIQIGKGESVADAMKKSLARGKGSSKEHGGRGSVDDAKDVLDTVVPARWNPTVSDSDVEDLETGEIHKAAKVRFTVPAFRGVGTKLEWKIWHDGDDWNAKDSDNVWAEHEGSLSDLKAALRSRVSSERTNRK